MRNQKLSVKLLTFLSIVVIALMCVGVLLVAQYIRLSLTQNYYATYTASTRDIRDNINSQMNEYASVLYSARAYINSNQNATNREWAVFVNNQNTFSRNPGLNAIMRIEAVADKDKPALEKRLRANTDFGPGYSVKPEGTRAEYGIATLFTAQNDSSRALGFDVFSTKDRLDVYNDALTRDEPTLSHLLRLSTGYDGFFMVLPVKPNDKSQGFVVALFNKDELFSTLFREDALATGRIEVVDTSAEPDKVIYASSGTSDPNEKPYHYDDLVLASRRWRINHTPYQTPGSELLTFLLPSLVLVCGLVLITSLLASLIFFLSKAWKVVKT